MGRQIHLFIGYKSAKGLNSIWEGGFSNILTTFGGLNKIWFYREKRCSKIGKPKSDISQKQNKKIIYHSATPLLEKKPENIIVHLGTNE